MLIGSNDNEFGLLSVDPVVYEALEAIDAITIANLLELTCPVNESASYRVRQGVNTWR
jgi:hypothetical protein